ncbi:MAG: peptidase M14, partial [Candidatus Dadabacteria bacterium]|nr:peptidase M14 [Candidatus Dadabacteria bacterium]
IIESIPEGLLSLPAPELHNCLNGPTLIHLSGKKEPAVFVSVLLHGNEHTGWEVIKNILNYSGNKLPRSMSIFIGNIKAARYNKRFLEGQPDFNRIWNGGN